MPNFGREH